MVEIEERYDRECIPPIYSNHILQYIQSVGTDKTCTRRLTVSPIVRCYILNYFFHFSLGNKFLVTVKCALTGCYQVPKHMKSPVFIYYQLTNFYQNYRMWVYLNCIIQSKDFPLRTVMQNPGHKLFTIQRLLHPVILSFASLLRFFNLFPVWLLKTCFQI